MFDRVYINHLESQSGRLESFQIRFAAVADWPAPQPIIFTATDGTTQGEQPAAALAGNMASWRAVLADAITAESSCILVLEDDVLFAPDFSARLAQVLTDAGDAWDFLALGARPWGGLPACTRLTERLVQAPSLAGTYALAIRGAAIAALAAYLESTDAPSLGSAVRAFIATNQSILLIAAPPLVGHAAGPSTIWGNYPSDKWWPEEA